MVDLIPVGGSYRTYYAKPNKEEHLYAPPYLIAHQLQELCNGVRLQLSLKPTFSDRIKIVASFLSVFLDIHPFENGNGRTGRIMASLLLSDDCTVCVPLVSCSWDLSRDTYLTSLREAQREPYSPGALARLIMESIVRVHRLACTALDLPFPVSNQS
jgi:Fic family protein